MVENHEILNKGSGSDDGQIILDTVIKLKNCVKHVSIICSFSKIYKDCYLINEGGNGKTTWS